MNIAMHRFLGLAFLIIFAPILTHANDQLVVYIECTGEDGQKSQGSGVLVSKDGHVLTARHVVQAGSTCQASIGNNTRQKRGIRPSFATRSIDDDFDALLMEFGKDKGEVFPFANVCEVTDALKQQEIIAKGFHPDSFGGPSATDGILSNTTPNFDGIIETSAMTINGKSGGPIFLKDTDTIVGIVAGAKFNELGVVSYYGMLASNAVVNELNVLSKSCDVSAPAPTPTVIEYLTLYQSADTFHIGDEAIRSWAPLTGPCLQIPFNMSSTGLKRLTLKSNLYGAENTYILINGRTKPFHSQPIKPNKKRPNYWSDEIFAEFEVDETVREISICSQKVPNPENPNDLDDFQIKNLTLTGEFAR